MNKLIKAAIFFFSLISITPSIAQTFRIKGTANGIQDGTWLYLRTASPEKLLDSVKVKNGQFNLRGSADEIPIMLYIYTENYTNYVRFWAEKDVTIRLNSNDFKKAIFKGSKTQLENEKFTKLKLPFEKAMDSLTQLYEAATDTAAKTELRAEIRTTRNDSQQFDMTYIKANPNSIFSAYLLEVYGAVFGRETTDELYQNLSAQIRKTSFGVNVNRFIELNKSVRIGDKFPDFEQLNYKDDKVSLSSITCKYILLEFWASWCGPCRQENPSLVATYNLFHDKGFEILGVSADQNRSAWLKAIEEDKLPWENVSDLRGDKNEAALIYGVTAYPSNFLINEEGIIIAKDLRGNALNKKLEELLP